MNRTLLLGAAWTASAGAAVGLGFLAVSLVDATASPTVQPVASSALESGDPTAAPSPSSSPAPTGQQATAGGTVFASCARGSAVPVLSGAPAAGWWPDDSQQPGTFEFKSASQSLEVRVTCVGGVPQFAVEGPQADDNGGGEDGGGDDGGTPAAPSTDDHGGATGGGADDPATHDVGDDQGGGSNSGSGSSGSGGSGSGSGGSGSGGSGGHGSDD